MKRGIAERLSMPEDEIFFCNGNQKASSLFFRLIKNQVYIRENLLKHKPMKGLKLYYSSPLIKFASDCRAYVSRYRQMRKPFCVSKGGYFSYRAF